MQDVRQASQIAEALLAAPLPRRWAHTQGVATAARRLAPILGTDADIIEAAAWLHDIGYAPDIARTGFHPLDGARYLRKRTNADALLRDLVAFHTGAIHEARERGMHTELTGEFTPPPPPLGDALTYCDLTTSPDGEPVDAVARIAEIQRRYGAEHLVSRAIGNASEALMRSVQAIEERLRL